MVNKGYNTSIAILVVELQLKRTPILNKGKI